MKPNDFEALIESAAAHAPDTAAAELGFETRLMARIRELRDSGSGSLFEVLATWSWRSAFGLSPFLKSVSPRFDSPAARPRKIFPNTGPNSRHG